MAEHLLTSGTRLLTLSRHPSPALQDKARADQEKDKRRADTVFEKIALAAAGAMQRHGTEERFESVKIGDKDSYAGEFVFVRNEDRGWRVESADYR